MPNGWFVNDAADYGENGDEYLSEEAQELQQMGGLMVDQFCPQETGEMDIGGEQDCNLEKPGLSPDTITVVATKYNFDLPHMYEFANVINTGADVTTNDLLIWELDRAKGPPSLAGTQMQNTDVNVVNQTDRTADLVDLDGTVVAPGAVQVKEAQYTYRGFVDEANGLQTPDQIVTLLLAVYNDPESEYCLVRCSWTCR